MPRREPPLADQDASQGFPTDGPSPDDALLTQRLSTLDSLASQLASLRSSFRCPNYLQFQPHSTASNPVLAFSPINAPVLAYDDNLVRFLTQLDEVQSDGQLSVRNRRRELVKEVEGELGGLDRLKREEFVRQMDGGGLIASVEEQRARELRERKERVDGMLGSMGRNGGPSRHKVADGALEHNSNGKREDGGRGRGYSPIQGPPAGIPQESERQFETSPPKGSRFTKVRKTREEASPTNELPPQVPPKDTAPLTRKSSRKDRPYMAQLPSMFDQR